MVLKKFGGTENFAIKELPRPRIGDKEVLIRVLAIGLNPIDVKTRKGLGIAKFYLPDVPVILGWDVSGVIVKVGAKVRDFKVGNSVFGTINFPGCGNAYAEYIVAPANQIALKPCILSHEEAAAATLSALTAWQALVDTGNIKKGDKVLIHGAAGDVGSFAVQIAKYLDAYVVGTASGKGVEFAKELGADKVVDYKTQRFEYLTDGFDFILDTVGGENFTRSLKVLKPDGTIVLLPSEKVADAEKMAVVNHVRNYHHILMHSDGKEMQQIAILLEGGRMQVHVDKVFPFEELPKAHEALERGKIKGKVVIAN